MKALMTVIQMDSLFSSMVGEAHYLSCRLNAKGAKAQAEKWLDKRCQSISRMSL